MDETAFASAAFNHHERPALLQALQADPVLLTKARDKLKALELAHQRGRIFDRDAISRITHEMLTRLIEQVDAGKSQEPQVRIV